MAVNQDNVSKILSILSHPLRREILFHLSEKGECSFTDLMNALDVDTGKLSFHIRSLGVFLEQTSTGKYRVSKAGENAIRLIKDVEVWAVEAEVAGRSSALPFATLRKRVYAFLIDFVIIFAMFWVLPELFYLLTRRFQAFLEVNLLLFFLIIFWIYFTLLEGFAGQSLGKNVIGLKVLRVDGKRFSYDYAAVRNFGKVFLLPFDLAVGLGLDDEKFIRYFDKFAGTTVIDLRL